MLFASSGSAAEEAEGESSTLPSSINVSDYSRAYFIERAGEVGVCIQEVPNPDLVMDSTTSVAALMAIQVEYQVCNYKLQAVLQQAYDWQGAILCAKDRQKILQSEGGVEVSAPDLVEDPLEAAFAAFVKDLEGPSGSQEQADDVPVDPLDQRLAEAEIAIEQLGLLLAELDVVQAVIGKKITELRMQDQLRSPNPKPFGKGL